MEPIITIKNQQFYYTEVNELVDFSANNKCAVIVDESKLQAFFNAGVKFGEAHITQIIVISDTLNSVMENLKNEDVLVISATSFEEAIRLAIHSTELNEKVVCVTKEDSPQFKETIELVMV